MQILKKILIITMMALQLPLSLIAQHPENDFVNMEIHSSKHWIDIDYVGDGHIGHRMDIHLPEQKREKYPVVISIYGSAWFSNNSKGVTYSQGIGQAFLNAGYAVVTINHRASFDAKFPAQIHDVKAAIRFVRANALSFSLDASFITFSSSSSRFTSSIGLPGLYGSILSNIFRHFITILSLSFINRIRS